MRKQLISFRR